MSNIAKAFEKGKAFIYTATVAIKPEVTLGEYKGVEVEKVSAEVADSDVDAELEAARHKNGRLITVEDRPVADGDNTVIDFKGFIDGKAFDGGEGIDYPLTIGSHSFIDTFEEQLIGKNLGDKCEIEVTFPEEYHAKELAGKEATFKCKVHKVEETILPAIDDEFAKDVSDTCETLDDLKKEITERLKNERQEAADAAFEEKLLDVVLEGMKADIPQAMIESQIDSIVQDFGYRLQMQGMGLEQYLKMTGMSEDKLLEDARSEPAILAQVHRYELLVGGDRGGRSQGNQKASGQLQETEKGASSP